MAEQTTPLAAMLDAFDSARGEEMDGVWAFSASWALLMRDVDVALVVEGLRDALDVVRETQESPAELFGTGREHADALYEQWLAEGRLVLDDGVTTWRDAVVVGLWMSVLFAAALVVLLVVRDQAGTDELLRAGAISLVVGLGASFGQAAWSRRHRGSTLGADVLADARWSIELTEILRSRYAMSGRRVRTIIAEAQHHVAESGRTVEEEFGTPREYAARFAPDLARRARWMSGAFAALAILAAIQLVDGFDWTATAMTAICCWWAVREHRNALRHRAGGR
ncbi:membrane hypothetical protein [metagenome]|uniref:Uncharacterized protein n=1 Tax=metagenome TaxID=256318 RepID=A0A2P2C998_9ZZZZ